MEKIYTVRLEDDTVGTISDYTIDGQDPDSLVGQRITVSLQDENGNPIEVEGILAEILE